MSSLNAAYINEIYKISKKKKLVVAALLSIASVFVAALIVTVFHNFTGVKITGSSEFAILVLSVLIYTLIPLFTAFVCIDMINGEWGGEKTIKLTLTQPASRLKVYTSKMLAAATFILGNLLFVMVVAIIGSFFVKNSMLSIGSVIAAYLASFFPLLIFALFVMVVSNIARGSASAFLITVVAFLALNGLGLMFPTYQSFLFTATFDWYTLFIGSFINVHKILRVFLIIAGYGVTLFSLGYFLFERKDV